MSEIEARISALPDEKSRGDAFEVFAEAYLATQRKYDSANVWPLSAVPSETLQSLALPSHDCGVDGIFKTLLGHFSAYQVKFRSNRPSLTWRELSTFMGLADSQQIRIRVLITNCDDCPRFQTTGRAFSASVVRTWIASKRRTSGPSKLGWPTRSLLPRRNSPDHTNRGLWIH